jgi:hypothetical protein
MQPANRTHWNNSIYFWYWELSTEIRFAVGKVSRDKTAVAAGDPIVIWLHIQYRGSTTSLGKVLQKLVCPLLSISLPHKADHQSYSHFCCLGHKSAAGPFISIMSPFPSSVTNKGGGGGTALWLQWKQQLIFLGFVTHSMIPQSSKRLKNETISRISINKLDFNNPYLPFYVIVP